MPRPGHLRSSWPQSLTNAVAVEFVGAARQGPDFVAAGSASSNRAVVAVRVAIDDAFLAGHFTLAPFFDGLQPRPTQLPYPHDLKHIMKAYQK